MFQTLFNFAFGGPEAVYARGRHRHVPRHGIFEQGGSISERERDERHPSKGRGQCSKTRTMPLPLKQGAKVSVFGKNSVNLSYGNSRLERPADIADAKERSTRGSPRRGSNATPCWKNFIKMPSVPVPCARANSGDLDSGRYRHGRHRRDPAEHVHVTT